MTESIETMVCGCMADHITGCILGHAETIASEGLEMAAADTHPLTSALVSLTEAGLLAPTAAEEYGTVHDILMGLLDDLYTAGLLTTPPGDAP